MNLPSSDMFQSLLFGQLLAIVYTGIGGTNSLLQTKCNINIPAFQTGLIYVLLSFHLLILKNQQKRETSEEIDDIEKHSLQNERSPKDETFYLPFTKIRLGIRWYHYAMIALLDSQIQFVTFLSYHFTTITSVTILGNFSIPFAMIFSKLILKRKYSSLHYFGVLICVLGFSLTMISDASKGSSTSNKHLRTTELVGDLLCIIGAIMAGLNDTLTETVVKKFDPAEYLGMVGLFGSCYSFFEVWWLEQDSFKSVLDGSSLTCSSSNAISLVILNCVIAASYYVLLCKFLTSHDAAFLEVSLLTGTFYTAAFTIIAEHVMPNSSYYLSCVLVILGICVYEKGTTHLAEEEAVDDKDSFKSDIVAVKNDSMEVKYGSVDVTGSPRCVSHVNLR